MLPIFSPGIFSIGRQRAPTPATAGFLVISVIIVYTSGNLESTDYNSPMRTIQRGIMCQLESNVYISTSHSASRSLKRGGTRENSWRQSSVNPGQRKLWMLGFSRVPTTFSLTHHSRNTQLLCPDMDTNALIQAATASSSHWVPPLAATRKDHCVSCV